MTNAELETPNAAQPTNISGTNRSYRVPDEDTEAWETAARAANTRLLTVSELPVEGKTQVKTEDGRGHIEGLEQYECSDRWGFPFTDAAEKYQPLEIRNARYGGTIIRSEAYPVEDSEMETVQLHFTIGTVPSTLKESPGHMEPQLSTAIRTAVKKAKTADDGD